MKHAILAGLLVTAVIAPPAFAHVTLERGETAPGSYKAVLRVPHGCGREPTTGLTLTIPEGVHSVKPQPKPGWALATRVRPYQRAYVNHGREVREGVTEVSWSGGSLPNEHYDEFVFVGQIDASLAAAGRVFFPVVQTCANGENRWVEVPVAGGDIYPALEKGTIDAAEWVDPYDDEKLGFNKVAPFYYYPGWGEGGPTVHAMVNLEKWNALPKSYQATLTNACTTANTVMQAKYDLQNPAALRRLVAAGTQLRPFSEEVIEACFAASNQIYGEISARNADFKKIIDAMESTRSEQYLWWQVAEFTNDAFMIRARSRTGR